MRARLLVILAAVLALQAAMVPHSPARADDAVTLTGTDCSMLAATGDDPRPLLGKITCGVLEVPEDWDRPDGRRIAISWTILRAESRSPLPDPGVYLAGGPGGSALADILTSSQLFAPLRKDRDILLFDQRGAAFSTPLRCNDWTMDQLLALSVEGLLAPEQPGPGAPEAVMPASADARALLQAAREELGPASERCAGQFAGAVIDLTRSTSGSSARDTRALLVALGYDTFNLYGISYGTRLALTIARDFPDSGLRSMVLDSVFPPQINGFEQYPALLPEVAIQLFASCRRDTDCNRWYPGLGQRFAALLPLLDANPAVSALGPVASPEVIGVMEDLSVNVEAAPYIPRMVAELEQGRTETWEAIVTGRILGYAPAPASPPANDAAGTIDEVRAAVVQLAARLASGENPGSEASGRFVEAFTREVAALPSGQAADIALRTIFLGKLPHERATLEEFVDRSFPGRQGAKARITLRKAVSDLSDADVAALFARMRSNADALDPYAWSLNPHLFSSVACNEEVPFERLEAAVEVARAQPIPELAAPGLAEAAAQFAICEQWPLAAPDPAENLPVRTSVPALLLAGSYDGQTPPSWSKTALVTLPNAVFVDMPMSGHGVLQYSACAEKVVRAFVAFPDRDPATTCVAGLRPRFLPPDGPLRLPAPTTPTP
ncbi:MAG: alpha/beta fold hydrolase [Chloroflexota bacterium]